MADSTKELRGTFRSESGSTIRVNATIFEPQKDTVQEHWFCVVRCPFLFDSDKRIAGIDASQALELAELFLRDLLTAHSVVIEDAGE